AADLTYAKVFVSSFMDDQSVIRGVEGLKSAAGFIQCSIARKLTIYKFPKLNFIADFSMKEGYKMVQKLNALEAESKERESQTENAEAGEETESEAK
ncbi:MAG: 30S ribosome-binding factor RbfA, partial [Spirochaetales bacterium]|nr:30S ribosome-binding factor RbfA [Spirochaetales bacterium]